MIVRRHRDFLNLREEYETTVQEPVADKRPGTRRRSSACRCAFLRTRQSRRYGGRRQRVQSEMFNLPWAGWKRQYSRRQEPADSGFAIARSAEEI